MMTPFDHPIGSWPFELPLLNPAMKKVPRLRFQALPNRTSRSSSNAHRTVDSQLGEWLSFRLYRLPHSQSSAKGLANLGGILSALPGTPAWRGSFEMNEPAARMGVIIRQRLRTQCTHASFCAIRNDVDPIDGQVA